jgi:hypothetical protein
MSAKIELVTNANVADAAKISSWHAALWVTAINPVKVPPVFEITIPDQIQMAIAEMAYHD